ncbi:hypothetical protein P9112_004153 [Eukaryota sp. TZLM1-RC]
MGGCFSTAGDLVVTYDSHLEHNSDTPAFEKYHCSHSEHSDPDSLELIANNYITSTSTNNMVSLGFADSPASNSPNGRRSGSFLYAVNQDLTRSDSTLSGDQINWVSGELLGRGAFGSVYLGLDSDTGILMAVKEFPTSDKSQAELEEIQQEINLMRDFSHENIVRYYGCKRSRGLLHVFMEYVPGGSIASLLRKFSHFSADVVKHYTRQILEGVSYLHSHSIIHRDLKGANLLIDNNGVVKVADFGASRKLQGYHTALNECRSLKGTPFWMAPEVIEQAAYGRAADIWSIGCCVIEMLSGRPPWSEFPPVTALFHIARSTQPPKFPKNISSEAKDFLIQCFHRDPKLRPSANQLLLHPFVQANQIAQQRRSSVVYNRREQMISPSADPSRRPTRTPDTPEPNKDGQRRRSSHTANSLLVERMLAERSTLNSIHTMRSGVKKDEISHPRLNTIDECYSMDNFSTKVEDFSDDERSVGGASIVDIKQDVERRIRYTSQSDLLKHFNR